MVLRQASCFLIHTCLTDVGDSADCISCGKTLIIDDNTLEARNIVTGERAGYCCHDHLMKDDDGNILTTSPFTDKDLRYLMLQEWIEWGLDIDRILEFQQEIQSYTIGKLEEMLSLTHDSLWDIRQEKLQCQNLYPPTKKDEQEALADLSVLNAEFKDRGINYYE